LFVNRDKDDYEDPTSNTDTHTYSELQINGTGTDTVEPPQHIYINASGEDDV